MRRTLPSLLAAVCLAACGAGLDDPLHPTGSTSVVVRGTVLWAANAVEGTVSLVDTRSGDVTEVDVGHEPIRLAPLAKGRMAVTVRGDGDLVVLGRDGAELDRVRMGAEPYGVVATEDGSRVYVAVAMDQIVVELDGDTLEWLRSWRVDGEPRWLALHPSGRALFVGSVRGEPLRRIDLRSDRIEVVEIPATGLAGSGRGGPPVHRGAGDPAFSADGQELAVPLGSLGVGVSSFSSGGYYASEAFMPPDTITRVTPFVTVFPTNRSGQVDDGGVRNLLVPGMPDVVQGVGVFRRGLATSVTWAPDGDSLWTTMEGADLVVVLASGAFRAEDPDRGYHSPVYYPALVPAGPGGLAFAGRRSPWVHSSVAGTVASIEVDAVLTPLENRRATSDYDTSRAAPSGEPIDLSSVELDPDWMRGRELFTSAYDPYVTTGGVSCTTCHVDGRDDGQTWTVDTGDWQTPSLAGETNQTAPLTWSSSVASVADEAAFTTVNRMGGAGLTDADLAALETFVESVRLPSAPSLDVEGDVLALGQELFEDADVGCSVCHSGPKLTDNRQHTMFGEPSVNTPSLRGVGSTAPYLHDGRAGTLREVLLLSIDGEMGSTAGLTTAQLDALEAYLRTL